jgi:hypothetical protein
LSEKFVQIDKLERSKADLIDLGQRFKSKTRSETFIQDLITAKVDAVANDISSARSLLAQLRAALALLKQYEFIRAIRANEPSGEIDASAFGPDVDPLFDASGISSKSQKPK